MEKLIIEPDKIIHILLKHLMDQRNEIAYMKNKAGLITYNNGIAERSIGINKSDNSNSHEGIGINDDAVSNSQEGIGISDAAGSNSLKGIGISDVAGSNSFVRIGISDDAGSNSLKGIGISDDAYANPNKGIAISDDAYANPNKGIAISDDDYTNPNKRIAINNIVEALSALEGTANEANGLYSVFEIGLISALEQYIKNGSGEAILYSFYADFEEAINDKNSLADKEKQAITKLQLEDTHILPAQITADAASLSRLQTALYGHLPRSSKQNMYENVAHELLFLHNTGTSKQTPLRLSAEISVSGFSKHLPKLKQYGLIKELPSKNYALTDKSIHILLELFGEAKTH